MSEKMYLCEVLATELASTGVNRRDERKVCHWTTVWAVDEKSARLTIALAYAKNPHWLLEEIGCVKEYTQAVKEKLDVEID